MTMIVRVIVWCCLGAQVEVEQEQEQEQEREVEIEKYVDLDYCRDGEEPEPWNFDDVSWTMVGMLMRKKRR
jgi:hypothetical protein